MKFSVMYPLVAHPHNPEFLTKDALARFCRVAEESGFDGISFTEHPAPTHRWLESGGHDALDPLVALAFCAAVTDRMNLIPDILVLPYRNPLAMAKAVATIDALSDGRFILAVATGYLRGEYRALGVDFEQRNALFDEAVEVMRGIWTTDDFAYEGLNFLARGQTANPKPAPCPPIWVGGNSRLSRRRVARYGDGWSPFPAPPQLATTAKTPAIETLEDFAAMCDELWRYVEDAGRDPSTIDVSFGTSAGGDPSRDDFDAAARLEALDELAALGVTWCGVGVPGDSLSRALETIERFGTSVIQPCRS